jgi:hypothetical protein
MANEQYKRLTAEELERLAGEPLPERAAMSLIHANLAIPMIPPPHHDPTPIMHPLPVQQPRPLEPPATQQGTSA